MSDELLGALFGLALLDALNPATIAGVALILLAPLGRPQATAATFVAGAYLTVLAVGGLALVGAGAAAGGVAGGFEWLRSIALAAAALILARSGLQRLRTRVRPAVRLPPWLSPATAGPLGILMTGADLPNAFPYFLAIERLLEAGVSTDVSFAALSGYALVYVSPCCACWSSALCSVRACGDG